MEQITIDGYIHAKKESWQSEYTYHFFACDMSRHGYIKICEHPVKFSIPIGFNITAAEISVLEKELDSLSDKYMDSSIAIKSRIAELQCIEL
jgi:hypothetical protein